MSDHPPADFDWIAIARDYELAKERIATLERENSLLKKAQSGTPSDLAAGEAFWRDQTLAELSLAEDRIKTLERELAEAKAEVQKWQLACWRLSCP